MRNIEQRREERLQKIQELKRSRDKINAELDTLIGLVGRENWEASFVPPDFSLMKEIQRLFEGKNQLRTLQITALLKQKFPHIPIERRKVHSTLTYLVKKGKIKKEEGERGLFSLKVQS